MAVRFQPHFINPGCPTNLVVEFHRWLPNYLDSKQLGLGWKCEILLNGDQGIVPFNGPKMTSHRAGNSASHIRNRIPGLWSNLQFGWTRGDDMGLQKLS